VLDDTEARYNSADMNVAYRMTVEEYQRLCPYAEALEENWGELVGGTISATGSKGIPYGT
jgi:magnesium chelatase subunit H